MNEPLSEKEFQKRIRPSVRLFLSVDLIGSTKLKQQSQKSSRDWVAEIQYFFSDFNTTLSARIEAAIREDNKKKATLPKLWKALGDELVFVVEITRAHELLTLVEAFQKALEVWNEQVLKTDFKGNLPVKGSAWIAGFPVGNTVIDIPKGTADFAGPSIDAGFRISSLSTKRRLALSVELAWLLIKARCRAKINYEGIVALKGLSEDIGYPHLWIEVGNSEYLKRARKLSGLDPQSPDEILELCAHYIQEFGVPNHLPFLAQEPKLSEEPKDYKSKLEIVTEELRKQQLPDGKSGTKVVRSRDIQLLIDGVVMKIPRGVGRNRKSK